ncbi:MAG TPA: sensor histidine kinase, partial [Bryobacteraceae bacterium]
MFSPPKIAWTRLVPWVRVALAAATLALTYVYLTDAPSYLYGLEGLYLACGALVAVRGKGQSGMLGLLALFGDTVFFLIVVSYGSERLFWLAALFFLYLMAEALVFYGPVELGIIAGVSAVFGAALPAAWVRSLEPTIVVGGALACAFAISRRMQASRIESLSGAAEEAQKAAEKAREEERQRIAADFHDGPLQSFISMQMRLEIVRKLLERDMESGMQDLKQLQTLSVTQVRDLRAFLHSMRPVDVEGGNLVATARRTAESFQKESGIPVTFMGASTPVGLPQEMTLEVLQMLREALHNVQKHAGATRVAVAMEKTDRGLEISVDDNGHGFSFAGTYSLEELELLRLGPASLKRRAKSLNADLLLESRPGRGAGLK